MFEIWRATISVDGQQDVHCEGADRDRVVADALTYAPDATRADLAHQLAYEPHTLWLFPSRLAQVTGAKILVEKVLSS